MKKPLQKPFLNQQQIAAALGVSRRTVGRWVEQGCPLLSHRRERAQRFDVEAVREWVEARKCPDPADTAGDPSERARVELELARAQGRLAAARLAALEQGHLRGAMLDAYLRQLAADVQHELVVPAELAGGIAAADRIGAESLLTEFAHAVIARLVACAHRPLRVPLQDVDELPPLPPAPPLTATLAEVLAWRDSVRARLVTVRAAVASGGLLRRPVAENRLAATARAVRDRLRFLPGRVGGELARTTEPAAVRQILTRAFSDVMGVARAAVQRAAA